MSYLLVISPNHLSINVEIVFEHDTIYRYTRTDKSRFLITSCCQMLTTLNLQRFREKRIENGEKNYNREKRIERRE